MNCLPRVLIVDESAESREVLRTLLERRGAVAIEAERPEQALPLADLHRPHLIVMDADSDDITVGRATDALRDAAERNDTPIVILGTLPIGRPHSSSGEFIAKPYHYASLVRKIECLLGAA